jgi:magnesium-transporting ATPase (P-type)
MAFATIALAELVLVFAVRTPHRPAWHGSRNDTLLVAVIGSVLVVAAAIYVPLGRELTGTAALGPFELGVVLALAFAPAALVEVAKLLRRRQRSTNGGGR